MTIGGAGTRATDGVVGAVMVLPVDGVGEVGPGDDLGDLIATAAAGDPGLQDGDVLVVTSKVVSKAEGRSTTGDKAGVLPEETDRVVARRGTTSIVRTRHGLVLAGAGIDASNTAAGTLLLLPEDPDASARRLRERVRELTGRNVAVVVTDTAGRAWRNGQTDVAIGAAGLAVLHDYAGRVDGYGNALAVTAPAVADEIAAAGDLVKGKLSRRPAAVLRGLGNDVLPVGQHGPGAVALVRAEDQDMFGLGAREAVLAAVAADASGLRGFGAVAAADEVVRAISAAVGTQPEAAPEIDDGTLVVPLPDLGARALGRWEAHVAAVAFAHGWVQVEASADEPRLRFRARTP